ncbi:MAG: DUF3352 domain-containing protein [Phycisphaerae bacterium]
MNGTRRRQRAAWVIVFGLCAAAGAQAGGLDDFPLLKAIPADAHMVHAARDHAGREFLKKQEARVWDAVSKSNLDRSIRRFFKTTVEAEGGDVEEFERHWQQMSDLLAGVDWAALCSREWAFAMKSQPPVVELLMLLKPPADKIEDTTRGLAAFLKTLSSLAPDALELTEEKADGLDLHRLGFSGAPFPFAVTIASYKDTIIVTLGSAWFEQTLAALKGKAEGGAIADAKRFTEAFKALPAPKDSLTFIDVSKLMESGQAGIDMGLAAVKGQEGGADDAADGQAVESEAVRGLNSIKKLIDGFDLWEHVAMVSATDGMKTVADEIAVFKPGAEKKMFYPVFFGNGSIKDPLRYIPMNAGNVSVGSGIDWAKLYSTSVSFIEKELPNGAEMIEQWKTIQADELNLDVEKDVFGWIQGGYASFAVPGATQYSPGEFAFMIRVRDEAKANEMIGRLFEAVGPLAQAQGVSITDVETDGLAGFRSVFHPLVGMIGLKEPTIGVKEGFLFFGSSPKVIASALAVGSGTGDNFSKNERFMAEGIKPESNVVSLSFADQTRFGAEVGQALKMIPAVANMMGAGQDPKARAMLSILGDVGRIVEKMDYFLSTSAQSTMDGKVAKTKRVTNYREPPPPPAPKEGENATEKDGGEKSAADKSSNGAAGTGSKP